MNERLDMLDTSFRLDDIYFPAYRYVSIYICNMMTALSHCV